MSLLTQISTSLAIGFYLLIDFTEYKIKAPNTKIVKIAKAKPIILTPLAHQDFF
ncbi:Hypothetical protein BN2458_PEG0593 [Helicobacter typhlonius]|uniref:Uncharacterized protein n=1 Tax=Helicobacter typhlonius TaxID=76936 RepID=A0A0S4PUY8_9HELI|nr:Hypothetical protein BN2458_PEG0593 [Helicobacter typhlonius]